MGSCLGCQSCCEKIDEMVKLLQVNMVCGTCERTTKLNILSDRIVKELNIEK